MTNQNISSLVKVYSEFIDENRIKKWTKILNINDDSYAKDAFVPLGSPENLTPKELDLISFNGNHDDWNYNNISILNFAGSHISNLLKIAHNIDTGLNVEIDEYKRNLKELIDKYLEKISFIKEPDEVIFNTTKDKNPTVTWDYKENNKPGLHIDSWELGSIEKRKKSSNRICMNLGPTDRYFIFFNIGIDSIKSELKSHKTDVNEIVGLFLRKCDVPLYGVLLKPGDAYIAPTEFIIHDGHIPDGRVNSTLTLRGEIEVDKFIE